MNAFITPKNKCDIISLLNFDLNNLKQSLKINNIYIYLIHLCHVYIYTQTSYKEIFFNKYNKYATNKNLQNLHTKY